eukprot:2202451-Prymnesium_polylepis.1
MGGEQTKSLLRRHDGLAVLLRRPAGSDVPVRTVGVRDANVQRHARGCQHAFNKVDQPPRARDRVPARAVVATAVMAGLVGQIEHQPCALRGCAASRLALELAQRLRKPTVAREELLRVHVLLGAATEAVVVPRDVAVAPLRLAPLYTPLHADRARLGAMLEPRDADHVLPRALVAGVQTELRQPSLGRVFQVVERGAELACGAEERRSSVEQPQHMRRVIR